VDSAFEGINGTIFAYGQTSSGKTFTCVGPDCDDDNLKGLLPRCVSSIFERIASSPNYLEFRIKISMVEIYMEKIRDLLDSSKVDLKIRENKTKGIYIQDVT
jgi:kinesin family protein 5